MPKYRQRSADVDAIQIGEVLKLIKGEEWEKIPEWLGDVVVSGTGIFVMGNHIKINDYRDGEKWIVRNHKGKVSVIHNDIFNKMYEPIE